MRGWNTGDNVNLAIGQGDLQATPLQLAVAYSTLATDGRVPTPHVGLEVENQSGELIQRIERAPARRIKIDENARSVIMDGLKAAAREDGGTSHDVFTDWPKDLPVYGKTGTAQRTGKPDTSWYAAYVPGGRGRSPIVVAVTVEERRLRRRGRRTRSRGSSSRSTSGSRRSSSAGSRARGEHGAGPHRGPGPAARRPAPAAGPAADRRDPRAGGDLAHGDRDLHAGRHPRLADVLPHAPGDLLRRRGRDPRASSAGSTTPGCAS